MHTWGEGPTSQAEVTQSALPLQILSTPHAAQLPPPQSLSLSAPSLRPSLQRSATHSCDSKLHTPLAQLASAVPQLLPVAHNAHVVLGAPQSMSLSPLSLKPSAQCEATHFF